MHERERLSLMRWDYKYHVVIVPKYRTRSLSGKVKRGLSEILMDLCRQRGVELLERHLMPDHIKMCLRVSAKLGSLQNLGNKERLQL